MKKKLKKEKKTMIKKEKLEKFCYIQKLPNKAHKSCVCLTLPPFK